MGAVRELLVGFLIAVLQYQVWGAALVKRKYRLLCDEIGVAAR